MSLNRDRLTQRHQRLGEPQLLSKHSVNKLILRNLVPHLLKRFTTVSRRPSTRRSSLDVGINAIVSGTPTFRATQVSRSRRRDARRGGIAGLVLLRAWQSNRQARPVKGTV